MANQKTRLPNAGSARNVERNVEDLYNPALVERAFADSSIPSTKLATPPLNLAFPEDPPASSGWLATLDTGRSGLTPDQWNEVDFAGVLPAGTKIAWGTLELVYIGVSSGDDVIVRTRPGNLTDVEDSVGYTLLQSGFSGSAATIYSNYTFPVYLRFPGAGSDDLKLDMYFESTALVYTIRYRFELMVYV